MYEKYKATQTYDEYYSTWEQETLDALSPELKDGIYNRYVVKATVFQRDKFRCTNVDCGSETNLTLHHIRYQRNGGKDSERNCVCLCKTCHKGFHQGKIAITYGGTVPSHIRGHTLKEHVRDRIDWKAIKANMAILRKNLKEHHGIRLTGEQVLILLRWLHYPYDEMMDMEGMDD
jgi:hypothetical protein